MTVDYRPARIRVSQSRYGTHAPLARSATIARMSTDERARPRISRSAKYTLIVFGFLAWTILANQWSEKGCDLVPQSYVLVLTHGTPDHWQGCESEPGGPQYTDQYAG